MGDEQTLSFNYCDATRSSVVDSTNASAGIVSHAIPDSLHANKIGYKPTMARHLSCPPIDVLCFSDFDSMLNCKANTEGSTLMESLESAPPIPLSRHMQQFENGSTSKMIAAKILTEEQGTSVPSIFLADVPVTQKLSPAKEVKGTKSGQPASALVQEQPDRQCRC